MSVACMPSLGVLPFPSGGQILQPLLRLLLGCGVWVRRPQAFWQAIDRSFALVPALGGKQVCMVLCG